MVPNSTLSKIFKDRQSIFELNTEIEYSGVHLSMSEQKLDGPQIAGLAVVLGDLRPSRRMRAIGSGVNPMELTQSRTRRAYCRVSIWRRSRNRHFHLTVRPKCARRSGKLRAHSFDCCGAFECRQWDRSRHGSRQFCNRGVQGCPSTHSMAPSNLLLSEAKRFLEHPELGSQFPTREGRCRST